MKNYHKHLVKYPTTLLSRFYGLYTIRISQMNKISFVIMPNLLGKNLSRIERVYDLKGSLHNRKVGGKVPEEQIKNTSALKDLDFLEREAKLALKEKIEIM